MSVYNFSFTGGVDPVLPYGQMSAVQFGATWSVGDTWTILVTSPTVGNLTWGVGRFGGFNPTACFTFRQRIYLAAGTRFLFSGLDLVLGPLYDHFEEQFPGTGDVKYTSQYGGTDTVQAFTQSQGQLVVIGHRTIQIWNTSGDPSQFSLTQILDNIGTSAPLSPANLGDYDALLLDMTGVRSLKFRETTLNAYVDDLGLAVDMFVRDSLETFPESQACAIVEPTEKHYWIYIGGYIYVLSRHLGAKIIAWSQYEPTDTAGIQFAPQKFVIYNRQVFIRTNDFRLIQYGGADGLLYDNSMMTVEIPWLDDKTPKLTKLAQGIDVAIQGGWEVRAGMDPESWDQVPDSLELVYIGQDVAGVESRDSTFDMRHISYNQQGTHFKIIARTLPSWDRVAKLSEVQFHYNKGDIA